jgi:hypothetical protein
LGSNADAWSNIESLKEIHLCSFRFTGFGKSSKVAPAYTPTYYADIVVVMKLKLKNVLLQGTLWVDKRRLS